MSNTLTQKDPNQISRSEHDENNDAKRVVLVGGGDIKLTANMSRVEDKLDEIIEAYKKNYSDYQIRSLPNNNATPERIIQIPNIIKEIEIREIEKPTIIKEIEYREIEKHIFIEKIVTVEVPIFIEKIQIKEVPVVIKEEVSERFPTFFKVFIVIQALGTVGVLLTNCIHYFK